MNLIDYHVVEVLSEPIEVNCDWGTYWKVRLKYWDDGGESEDWFTSMSLEGIKMYQPGFVGQH